MQSAVAALAPAGQALAVFAFIECVSLIAFRGNLTAALSFGTVFGLLGGLVVLAAASGGRAASPVLWRLGFDDRRAALQAVARGATTVPPALAAAVAEQARITKRHAERDQRLVPLMAVVLLLFGAFLLVTQQLWLLLFHAATFVYIWRTRPRIARRAAQALAAAEGTAGLT